MNLEELKKYDGKEGRKAYVACHGKVYDVTGLGMWDGGGHLGGVSAGMDATAFIDSSPHGMSKLDTIPVVADYEGDVEASTESISLDPKLSKKMMYRTLYKKFHPHPISVHFAMGMIPMAFFAQVLSLLLGGNVVLTTASTVAFLFGTVFLLPAIGSGLLSLYVNYDFKPNKYLKRKMILSSLALIGGVVGSGTACKVLHSPSIADANQTPFSVMTLIMLVIVLGIGYYGGKITWPDSE